MKSFDKTTVNEIVDGQMKSKKAEPSSSSTSFQGQEQMITAVAKKIKEVAQATIVICDDNSEENKEHGGQGGNGGLLDLKLLSPTFSYFVILQVTFSYFK